MIVVIVDGGKTKSTPSLNFELRPEFDNKKYPGIWKNVICICTIVISVLGPLYVVCLFVRET